MYYEQDYIMRLIREIVRTLLQLFFHIDTDAPTAELLEDEEMRNTLLLLQEMADAGELDEAENRLYDMLDEQDLGCLEIGLLYYSYLNEKDDDFLLEYQYSREEIQFGLRDLAARYVMSGIEDLFFGEDLT